MAKMTPAQRAAHSVAMKAAWERRRANGTTSRLYKKKAVVRRPKKTKAPSFITRFAIVGARIRLTQIEEERKSIEALLAKHAV